MWLTPQIITQVVCRLVDELVSQSTQTGMNVNGEKTKKMLIGSVIKNPPVPLLLLNDTDVDLWSTSFKLLGVHIIHLQWF